MKAAGVPQTQMPEQDLGANVLQQSARGMSQLTFVSASKDVQVTRVGESCPQIGTRSGDLDGGIAKGTKIGSPWEIKVQHGRPSQGQFHVIQNVSIQLGREIKQAEKRLSDRGAVVGKDFVPSPKRSGNFPGLLLLTEKKLNVDVIVDMRQHPIRVLGM
jgi:hypothetical protein